MRSELKDKNPSGKIHKSKYIVLATIFGGPLVGGYLIGHNFKVFNKPKGIYISWVVAILGMFFLLLNPFLFSKAQVYGALTIIGFGFLAYVVLDFTQSKAVENHVSSGGEFYSRWRTLLIMIIGIVITYGLFFMMAMLLRG